MQRYLDEFAVLQSADAGIKYDLSNEVEIQLSIEYLCINVNLESHAYELKT